MPSWRRQSLVLGLTTAVLAGVITISCAAAQTVATVNVQNAKVVSANGDNITVSFSISNRTGVQPGVRYGIVLSSIGTGSTAGQIIDVQIANASLDLSPNQTIPKTVTYTAPSYLSGTYQISVEAENSQGLPLGLDPAGKVTLKAATHYLEIVPSSCYLTVTQDATSTKYTDAQGVDVLPAETLIAHCQVMNNLGAEATLVPTFSTYARSVYGDALGSTSLASIDAAPGMVTQTFIIPKASVPQAYDTVLTIANASGTAVSNNVIFHYVLHGESATIQNLVFDKSSYKSGDTAQLSFFWTGSADDFPGSRLTPSGQGTSTVMVRMDDSANATCAAPFSQALGTMDSVVTLSIPVTSNCAGPRATIQLADAAGTVLAATTFTTAPTSTIAGNSTDTPNEVNNPTPHAWSWMEIAALIVILLVVIGFLVWLWVKKKKTVPMASIAVAIAIGGALSLIGAHAAKADTVVGTVFIYGETNHYYKVDYTFNLDNSQYAPGAPITATAQTTPALCNNGDFLGVTEDITATINNQTKNIYSGYVSEGNDVLNQTVFTAQTTPGSYSAMFVASSSYSDLIHNYGGIFSASVPVTDEIPYTVGSGNGNPNPTSTGTGQTPQQNQPLSTPNCTFYSNPSTVVVPQASGLNYSCTNVVSCNLQGGQFGYTPGLGLVVNSDFTTGGTKMVSLTTSTVFTLNCHGGGNNSNYVVDLQTDVKVASPNLFEVAP